MNTVTLSVPDMMCAHCRDAVTQAVSKLPGIDSVTVNLSVKQVEVCFHPPLVSQAQIKTAIEDQGFTVAL